MVDFVLIFFNFSIYMKKKKKTFSWESHCHVHEKVTPKH